VYVARGSDVMAAIVNGYTAVRDCKMITVNEPEVIKQAHAFGNQVREVMIEPGRYLSARGLPRSDQPSYPGWNANANKIPAETDAFNGSTSPPIGIETR